MRSKAFPALGFEQQYVPVAEPCQPAHLELASFWHLLIQGTGPKPTRLERTTTKGSKPRHCKTWGGARTGEGDMHPAPG